MQTRRKDIKKYFDILDRWRASIMLRRDDPLPIWLGHRVATATTGEDYRALVYDKGAWVLHMLRVLLLDLKAMNEDRFTAVMRDYWSTYRGRTASTADFEKVVERDTGQDMSWFFQEWVYRSAIPTYRYAWRAEQDGSTWRVKLRVEQEEVPPEFLMYVPVTMDLGNDQVVRVRVKVTGAKSEIDLPPVPVKPKALRFNDLHGVLAEVKEATW
jgi:aminopeptidase N